MLFGTLTNLLIRTQCKVKLKQCSKCFRYEMGSLINGLASPRNLNRLSKIIRGEIKINNVKDTEQALMRMIMNQLIAGGSFLKPPTPK